MTEQAAARDPLIVGVLYPSSLEPARLAHAARSGGRPLEVRVAGYEENSALRLAKRDGTSADELRVMAPPLTEAARSLLAEAEILLALDVPVDLLELAPRLRWIQAVGAGVRQFDEQALDRQGIRLTTAAGVGGPPIAEFVMGRLLQVWKDFRRFDDMQRDRVWRMTSSRTLAGDTIGIVGLGAIGTAVAERARAFGMRVVATRRRFTAGMTSPVADELLGPDGLDHLLAVSDAVVLAAPETPETEDLIGHRELALMKPRSVLCNVGRGALVDETALIAGLVAGQPAAAILDVTREEPLPATSALWDAPNLYLSAHSAAVHDGYFDSVLDLFGANIVRYVKDEPLVNLVDPNIGY